MQKKKKNGHEKILSHTFYYLIISIKIFLTRISFIPATNMCI